MGTPGPTIDKANILIGIERKAWVLSYRIVPVDT